MRRILRTIGIAAGFLVALLVSAAIAVWLLFDPNDYKDELAALVEARTGRSFVIEEDLELTFFPWLGVQTGGVRLGNAAGFGDGDFARAAGITARVRLLPLFGRRVEIGTVELDGVELNLARDRDGRGNWEDLLAAGSSARPATPTPGAGGGLARGLDIEGIRVRDGSIFWRNEATEVRYVLSALSLDTGPVAAGETVDAALNFRLVGVEPAFTAQLGARTTVRLDTSGQRYAAEDLALQFRVEDAQHDERVVGELNVTIELSGADQTIRVSEAALEAELTRPPVGPQAVTFRAAADGASIDLQAQTAELTGLTTIVGDIVARWELAGLELLTTPRLAGSVSIAQAPVADALELLGFELETDAEPGNLDLSSQLALELTTRSFALTELRGSALDMSFAGEVGVDERQVTGRVRAPAFDPTALLARLPEETIQGVDLTSVDSLELSADFRLDRANGDLSLSDFTVTVPGATLSGALDRIDDGRRLRGRIATGDIAPDTVLALFPGHLPVGLGPQSLGAVRASTRFDYDAGADSVTLDGLNARAFGLETSGDLVVRTLAGSPHLTGELTIEPFSPRTLFNRFDQPIPVTSDEQALGSAAISAAVDVSESRGQFERIRMQLDDTSVTGRFTVENFASPRYVFDLALDRVDVDRYLPPAGPDAAPQEPDAPPAGDLALPTEPLHSLALEGQVRVADLRMAGLSFANVSTSVSIEDGIGRVDSARAELYGGALEGGLELDARAGIPALSLRGSAIAIGLAPLLADLSGRPALSGIGTFDLELSGSGETLNGALATAAGRVDFSLREGAVEGFNLNHTLCDVFNRLKEFPRPAPTDERFTSFDLLRGTTQVSDGIARTTDLLAEAPSLGVAGRGQMDLVSKNVNYDLVATLTAPIAIPGCHTLDSAVGDSIPLEVTGTVTEPLVLPDFGELLRREIRDELQDRLLERLFNN